VCVAGRHLQRVICIWPPANHEHLRPRKSVVKRLVPPTTASTRLSPEPPGRPYSPARASPHASTVGKGKRPWAVPLEGPPFARQSRSAASMMGLPPWAQLAGSTGAARVLLSHGSPPQRQRITRGASKRATGTAQTAAQGRRVPAAAGVRCAPRCLRRPLLPAPSPGAGPEGACGAPAPR